MSKKSIGEDWAKDGKGKFRYYWRSDPRDERIRWRVFKERQSWIQFRKPGWYWYVIDQRGACDRTSKPVGPFPTVKAAKAACESTHEAIGGK